MSFAKGISAPFSGGFSVGMPSRTVDIYQFDIPYQDIGELLTITVFLLLEPDYILFHRTNRIFGNFFNTMLVLLFVLFKPS